MLVLLVVEALNLHLMPTDYHLQPVVLEKLLRLSRAVSVRTTPHFVRLPLLIGVMRGVRPHQVANYPVVLDLYETVNDLKLVYCYRKKY